MTCARAFCASQAHVVSQETKTKALHEHSCSPDVQVKTELAAICNAGVFVCVQLLGMHSARLHGFTCSCKTSWTRPRVLSTLATPTRKPTHRVSANLLSHSAAPFTALVCSIHTAFNIPLLPFLLHQHHRDLRHSRSR